MESDYLQVPRLELKLEQNMASLTEALEKQSILHTVGKLNWPDFPYKPSVRFRIGHVDDKIVLKFYVTEKAIQALETRINGAVFRDSCVEFFVSFDGENYYNFEINCIGTVHLAYGPDRFKRRPLSAEAVSRIEVDPSLGSDPIELRNEETSWELTAIIPVETLSFNPGILFKGREATANFYKCGDALPEPHFVTWHPVNTEKPDYHRPEFFGKIKFD